MAEPTGDHGNEQAATIRLLDERTAGDDRVCIRCLGSVSRETYFNTDFVCWPCDADWNTFPWQTTHTTGQLAP